MTMQKGKLERLLKEASDGDDRAFETLCGLYAPLLSASVRRFSGAADTDELMQEARMALFRAAGTFSSAMPQVTFGLYADICVNRALASHVRRSRRVPGRSLEELQEDGRWIPVDLSGSPDEKLIRDEEMQELIRIIESELSPFEQTVFRLRGEGCKNAEIARRLGVSAKSVENAVARVRQKARRLISDRNGS